MNGVSLEVDCSLDTAFVTLTGTWRLHCVMSSRSCDCRIAVPMGEQIDGGTNMSVKLRWCQKLLYCDGQFTLNIPFNFPEYVTPAAKKISKRETIQLNVNAGPGTEILLKTTSHPLKEQLRQAGKLGFFYESEVLSWSSSDFVFTYSVSSSHTLGVLLSPALVHDVDHRDAFCCYLFPGKQQSRKAFRREVVFAVDITGSMSGKLLEDTKTALFTALAKLDPEDLFNVIAFNDGTLLFSSSLERATAEAIEHVTQWINTNFVAGGGTNILLPLNQALKMLSDRCNSIPVIFLITDGSVEDERIFCDTLKHQLTNKENICPRIYTLGIGAFCNHYFLRMLAIIGRGHHDAASVDSIEDRMKGLFARASSVVLADIVFQNLNELDDLEVFPSQIPDLSSESPLIVSGRYRGTFPETLKINGVLPDMSNCPLDLKVHEAKEMPIDKIVAKHQIEQLTAQAWYSDNEELKEKIAKMSVQNAIISEYTNMVLLETDKGKINADSPVGKKVSGKGDHHKAEDPKPQKIIMLPIMGIGFGNLTATAENIPPGSCYTRPPDAAEVFAKAASDCCARLCGRCCCMCCIQTCSRMNDQCAILITQLCGALACLGCYACCGVCCGGND
ncbi:UNVERIFIED_CONTAM: Inter-alpha-trypsin inhibitor heavy chain H2 [Sesamum latifolium]|uniref:Inter-alpha-trypsin inhibitor heavy chain H2 n=1 Tax=Sesamum latifolium TaxID=2727402 RepID=A0AAW2U1K7_9LAMI